jgi:hypothetical protein
MKTKAKRPDEADLEPDVEVPLRADDRKPVADVSEGGTPPTSDWPNPIPSSSWMGINASDRAARLASRGD